MSGRTELVIGGDGRAARFTADGRLCEVCGPDGAWSFTPCWGWSLRRRWSDQTPDELRPCAPRVEQPDQDSLLLTFDRMEDDDGRQVGVLVELEWRTDGARLTGRIVRHELPDELRPAALAFPEVRFPYPEDSRWLLPDDLGRIHHRPCADQVHQPGLPGLHRRRPHMQFMAWLTGDRGLYLDSRDTTGWMRSMLLRVGSGEARLSLEHLLPQPAAGPTPLPDYEVSLAAFAGDWYEAARLYRPWALAQVWARRGPAQRRDTWVAEVAGWLWNRGRIDNVCPATKEVARRLGLPIALDWYWWHKKPYDTGYPDYFPPREGEEPFKAAVKDLQEHGVRAQVYTNGMSWEQSEPDWETEGRACTVLLQNGEYQGHIYNTWMNKRLMHTCGAAEGWHQRAGRTADGVAALGLDGLYLDQIAIAGGLTPCFSSEHGHVPGGGSYGAQGYRKLFETVRARHPNLALSSESLSETYQDLLECCITLQTSSERGGEVVPLFQAVYHGHAVVFGNYAHIDGITPYDELWPPEHRPDPAKERDWRALCPDQFALVQARTVAFGCQPLACNLTMAHLTDPDLAEDVEFFLDLCRFHHAHREWLLWGELLPPGETDCDTVEVTCIDRSIFTRPETIEPFTVERPAVLHSAWRTPDGRPALVLINYTRQPREVVVHRSDGLLPEGGSRHLLPARGLCLVPLREG